MLVKRRALAKPSVAELHFESKPKWNRDGKQTACSWESWTFLTGTPKGIETTRPSRRTKDRQWNPEDLALCACLSVHRGTRVASSLTHLEEFANVTSRELWYKHVERQTVAQPAKATRRLMCQGVGNVLRTSSIERNCQGNHVMLRNKTSLVVQLKRSYQAISVRKWSKNIDNMRQSRNPVQYLHSHPVRVKKKRCKSTRRLVVQESQKTRMTREQFAHAWR